MPDSLTTIHSAAQPVYSQQESPVHTADPLADIMEMTTRQAQEDLLQQALSTHSATPAVKQTTAARPHTVPSEPDTDTTTGTQTFFFLHDKEVQKGFAIDKPASKTAPKPAPSSTSETDASSWIILGLILLFLLIAFRMRRNFKYLKGLLHETVNSRSRHNMFEDTMRETTFSMLLNVLCVSCLGLLLAIGVDYYQTGTPPAAGKFPTGLWPCLAISGAYYLLQIFAYLIIGRTFTTPAGTGMWLQGFRAGSGLLGLALFPIALLSLFYPGSTLWLLTTACILYFLGRLLFIFKGIRIFSAHRTYYILFLYYLCSVEIVPVLLIWHLACQWG